MPINTAFKSALQKKLSPEAYSIIVSLFEQNAKYKHIPLGGNVDMTEIKPEDLPDLNIDLKAANAPSEVNKWFRSLLNSKLEFFPKQFEGMIFSISKEAARIALWAAAMRRSSTSEKKAALKAAGMKMPESDASQAASSAEQKGDSKQLAERETETDKAKAKIQESTVNLFNRLKEKNKGSSAIFESVTEAQYGPSAASSAIESKTTQPPGAADPGITSSPAAAEVKTASTEAAAEAALGQEAKTDQAEPTPTEPRAQPTEGKRSPGVSEAKVFPKPNIAFETKGDSMSAPRAELNYDFFKLIEAIKEKTAEAKEIKIDESTRATIQKIKELIEQSEQGKSQSYYGSDALNRMILNNPAINKLLSPDVIIALFTIDSSKNGRESIVINTGERAQESTIADVLLYGIKSGIDALKCMPDGNMERSVDDDYELYVAQKKQFQDTTTVLLQNIKVSADKLGISTGDDQFKPRTQTSNLQEDYALAMNVIKKIKENELENTLLRVPGYSPDDIRSQSREGFQFLCSQLHLTVGVNGGLIKPTQSDSSDVNSFNGLVDKILANPRLLVAGTVSHVFYDRAHFEACIEQDTTYQIGDDRFYLRHLLKELVEKAKPDTIAHEQLSVRLGLILRHLQQNFNDQYQAALIGSKNSAAEPVSSEQAKAEAKGDSKENELPMPDHLLKQAPSDSKTSIVSTMHVPELLSTFRQKLIAKTAFKSSDAEPYIDSINKLTENIVETRFAIGSTHRVGVSDTGSVGLISGVEEHQQDFLDYMDKLPPINTQTKTVIPDLPPSLKENKAAEFLKNAIQELYKHQEEALEAKRVVAKMNPAGDSKTDSKSESKATPIVTKKDRAKDQLKKTIMDITLESSLIPSTNSDLIKHGYTEEARKNLIKSLENEIDKLLKEDAINGRPVTILEGFARYLRSDGKASFLNLNKEIEEVPHISGQDDINKAVITALNVYRERIKPICRNALELHSAALEKQKTAEVKPSQPEKKAGKSPGTPPAAIASKADSKLTAQENKLDHAAKVKAAKAVVSRHAQGYFYSLFSDLSVTEDSKQHGYSGNQAKAAQTEINRLIEFATQDFSTRTSDQLETVINDFNSDPTKALGVYFLRPTDDGISGIKEKYSKIREAALAKAQVEHTQLNEQLKNKLSTNMKLKGKALDATVYQEHIAEVLRYIDDLKLTLTQKRDLIKQIPGNFPAASSKLSGNNLVRITNLNVKTLTEITSALLTLGGNLSDILARKAKAAKTQAETKQQPPKGVKHSDQKRPQSDDAKRINKIDEDLGTSIRAKIIDPSFNFDSTKHDKVNFANQATEYRDQIWETILNWRRNDVDKLTTDQKEEFTRYLNGLSDNLLTTKTFPEESKAFSSTTTPNYVKFLTSLRQLQRDINKIRETAEQEFRNAISESDQEVEEQDEKKDAGFNELDQAKEAFLAALTTSYKKFALTPDSEILETTRNYGYDEKIIATYSELFKKQLREHFLTHESLNSDDNSVEFFKSWTTHIESLNNGSELQEIFEDQETFLEAYNATKSHLTAVQDAATAAFEAAKAAATKDSKQKQHLFSIQEQVNSSADSEFVKKFLLKYKDNLCDGITGEEKRSKPNYSAEAIASVLNTVLDYNNIDFSDSQNIKKEFENKGIILTDVAYELIAQHNTETLGREALKENAYHGSSNLTHVHQLATQLDAKINSEYLNDATIVHKLLSHKIGEAKINLKVREEVLDTWKNKVLPTKDNLEASYVEAKSMLAKLNEQSAAMERTLDDLKQAGVNLIASREIKYGIKSGPTRYEFSKPSTAISILNLTEPENQLAAFAAEAGHYTKEKEKIKKLQQNLQAKVNALEAARNNLAKLTTAVTAVEKTLGDKLVEVPESTYLGTIPADEATNQATLNSGLKARNIDTTQHLKMSTGTTSFDPTDNDIHIRKRNGVTYLQGNLPQANGKKSYGIQVTHSPLVNDLIKFTDRIPGCAGLDEDKKRSFWEGYKGPLNEKTLQTYLKAHAPNEFGWGSNSSASIAKSICAERKKAYLLNFAIETLKEMAGKKQGRVQIDGTDPELVHATLVAAAALRKHYPNVKEYEVINLTSIQLSSASSDDLKRADAMVTQYIGRKVDEIAGTVPPKADRTTKKAIKADRDAVTKSITGRSEMIKFDQDSAKKRKVELDEFKNKREDLERQDGKRPTGKTV